MLNINTRTTEGVEIIALDGEVDMHVSPKFRDSLLAAFKKNVKNIIVDLSAVPYIDSSGIATLVEGLQWSKKDEGRFVLVGLHENVNNTLKLAKLDSFFEILPSEKDALDGIR